MQSVTAEPIEPVKWCFCSTAQMQSVVQHGGLADADLLEYRLSCGDVWCIASPFQGKGSLYRASRPETQY